MKRIQKAIVNQPHRPQAPKRSSLSQLNLSKNRNSRQILRYVARSTELSGGDLAIETKLAAGYYVYTINVAGVVRYIGKGNGLRLYSHMKEVRSRLKRDFRIQSIGSIFHTIEIFLTHATGSDVERSYRRGDMLDKRRKLMDQERDRSINTQEIEQY